MSVLGLTALLKPAFPQRTFDTQSSSGKETPKALTEALGQSTNERMVIAGLAQVVNRIKESRYSFDKERILGEILPAALNALPDGQTATIDTFLGKISRAGDEIRPALVAFAKVSGRIQVTETKDAADFIVDVITQAREAESLKFKGGQKLAVDSQILAVAEILSKFDKPVSIETAYKIADAVRTIDAWDNRRGSTAGDMVESRVPNAVNSWIKSNPAAVDSLVFRLEFIAALQVHGGEALSMNNKLTGFFDALGETISNPEAQQLLLGIATQTVPAQRQNLTALMNGIPALHKTLQRAPNMEELRYLKDLNDAVSMTPGTYLEYARFVSEAMSVQTVFAPGTKVKEFFNFIHSSFGNETGLIAVLPVVEKIVGRKIDESDLKAIQEILVRLDKSNITQFVDAFPAGLKEVAARSGNITPFRALADTMAA